MADTNGNTEQPFVAPLSFVAPHAMPLHVSVEVTHDDRGDGWVVLRVETVHGSHVAFMLADIADNVSQNLADAAARSRIAIIGGTN